MRRKGEGVELARALSKLGFASRAEARALIAGGQVTVNGRTAGDPRARIDPERARIEIAGRAVSRQPWTLVALNKPRGVVTTRRDPQGRPTVFSLLGELHVRVIPVGRLDLASTGLILLTNDTALANWLTSPETGVIRRYIVTVEGELSDASAARLLGGVVDRGEALAAARVEVLKRSKRETHLAIDLAEGKNREIRRMLNALGHGVTRLKRVAFGGLELGALAPGKWRLISAGEARAAFPGARLRL